MTQRVAIYARYSTDQQRPSSIDDQIRVCSERIKREGWTLARTYCDQAISGASEFRPQYQAMRADARNGAFDIVVAEGLDRLSRDQEDIAGLHKHLKFYDVRIFTLSEGYIYEMQIGFKGTMNAMFLKDLGAKTHRGLEGRIAAGKSAGGLCYGYSLVRQADARGELVRGDRSINEVEATVVRRIFRLFAGGFSPIAIAKTLNAANIPGPSGGGWRDTTIRGHAARGTGILRNELYVGRLVWDRMRFVKDPRTGKRVSRLNAEAQPKVQAVPGLQIVEHDVWEQVQRRLASIRAASQADMPVRHAYWAHRRAQHVLTGKLICGLCGGAFSAIGKPEFIGEWNRQLAILNADRATRERELVEVGRKLDNLVEAIANGLPASGSLKQKLDDLEARHAELRRDLAKPPITPPSLHPNLAELYRQQVEDLQAALTGPNAVDAIGQVRALISRVALRPAAEGRGLIVELEGAITEMVRARMSHREADAAAPDRGLFESSVEVVAGTGFEPVTFRL